MYGADYSIVTQTDAFVLIMDDDLGGVSITNDAESVVGRVDRSVGGLGSRHLYYVDSSGEIDELLHRDAGFIGFNACTEEQKEKLAMFVHRRSASCN